MKKLQGRVFILKPREQDGSNIYLISLHSQIWILVITAMIHVHYK
jgi:hypothetical protein